MIDDNEDYSYEKASKRDCYERNEGEEETMGTESSRVDDQFPKDKLDESSKISRSKSTSVSVDNSNSSVLTESTRQSSSTYRSSGSHSSNRSSRSRSSDSFLASQQRSDLRQPDTQQGKKKHQDPFAVHAVGIESMNIGSLSAIIGSLVMDRKREKQLPQEKQNPDIIHRNVRRSSTTRPASRLTAPTEDPILRRPRAQSMLDSLPPREQKHIQRIVEHDADALPRPRVETERKIADYIRSQSVTTTPMELPANLARPYDPPTSVAHSADEEEHLARLYDLRTWNMYKLINDARANQDHPSYENQDNLDSSDESRQSQAAMMRRSSSHSMMFDLDME